MKFAFTSTDHDRALLNEFPAIIGCDEVGRGCVAGPIVACAVRVELKDLASLENRVADSKKMSAKARADAYRHLALSMEHLDESLQTFSGPTVDGVLETKAGSATMSRSVTFMGSALIDTLGIQPCNKGVFISAIKAIVKPGDLVLVDGTLPELHENMRSIVRGESLSVAIAAASIIAKVTRDRLLDLLDRTYPGYGLAKHKGYGTAAHMNAIGQLGISKIHRKTFLKKFQNP